MNEKKPLYRKENTKARGCHHHKGSDAKYDRNTKKGMSEKMSQGKQRGLDFTPLYRFLYSKIGQNFDAVYSEAVSRLPKDNEDPIWYMVLTDRQDRNDDRDYFNDENAIWPRLVLDAENRLQLKNPAIKNEDFAPSCDCCTHTFCGKPLIRKYLNNRGDRFAIPEGVSRN